MKYIFPTSFTDLEIFLKKANFLPCHLLTLKKEIILQYFILEKLALIFQHLYLFVILFALKYYLGLNRLTFIYFLFESLIKVVENFQFSATQTNNQVNFI